MMGSLLTRSSYIVARHKRVAKLDASAVLHEQLVRLGLRQVRKK